MAHALYLTPQRAREIIKGLAVLLCFEPNRDPEAPVGRILFGSRSEIVGGEGKLYLRKVLEAQLQHRKQPSGEGRGKRLVMLQIPP